MPRLFTGIEIPGPQRAALSMLQSGLLGTRWTDVTDLHITLRFIGDVTPKQADTIVEALDARRWHAPHVAFRGLDVFGGTKPRSLYARVAEDEALSRLAASQERLMQTVGLKAEPRKFTPHVTIGRFDGNVTPDAVAHYLAIKGLPVIPPFTPTRFALYSARESTGGGPYWAEELFSFANA